MKDFYFYKDEFKPLTWDVCDRLGDLGIIMYWASWEIEEVKRIIKERHDIEVIVINDERETLYKQLGIIFDNEADEAEFIMKQLT